MQSRSSEDDHDDRVSSQEPANIARQLEHVIPDQHGYAHLADETVLVDTSALLSLAVSWELSPHLLDILKDHVVMSIECFYASKEFAVVATRDDDLVVVADSSLKDREGTSSEFVLFDASDFILAMQPLVDAMEKESRWDLRELAARLLQEVAVKRLVDARSARIDSIFTHVIFVESDMVVCEFERVIGVAILLVMSWSQRGRYGLRRA